MSESKDFLKIIPTAKEKSPGWMNYVFFIFLFPLLLVLVIYFIAYNNKSSLESQKTALEASIIALDLDQSNKEVEKEVQQVSKRLSDFSVILNAHKFPSRFFDFAGSFCHKQVQFTSFNLNAKNDQASLVGLADNFQALGEQLMILNQRADIVSPQVSGINLLKEGKVSFDLNLSFDKGVLTKKDE